MECKTLKTTNKKQHFNITRTLNALLICKRLTLVVDQGHKKHFKLINYSFLSITTTSKRPCGFLIVMAGFLEYLAESTGWKWYSASKTESSWQTRGCGGEEEKDEGVCQALGPLNPIINFSFLWCLCSYENNTISSGGINLPRPNSRLCPWYWSQNPI